RLARGEVAVEAEGKDRDEIGEVRGKRHHEDEGERRGGIEVDGGIVPENYELDGGEDGQIDDERDETPAIALSKFPGDCSSRRVHGYTPGSAREDVPTCPTKISSSEGT